MYRLAQFSSLVLNAELAKAKNVYHYNFFPRHNVKGSHNVGNKCADHVRRPMT